MDLSISPNSACQKSGSNINFTMARFSKRGYEYAKNCADVYEPFAEKTDYLDSTFYKKGHLFLSSPFEKYVKNTYRQNNKNDADGLIAETIVKYGCTDDSKNNAKFVKQLISTGRKKLSDGSKDAKTPDAINGALYSVLEKNWDNPELSKKDTIELAKLAIGDMNDKQFVVLTGVIENSNKRK